MLTYKIETQSTTDTVEDLFNPYNVCARPFLKWAGDYGNPTICDENNLLAVSKVLEIAEIKKADFKEINLGVPLRVGLSASIFLPFGTKRIYATIPHANAA